MVPYKNEKPAGAVRLKVIDTHIVPPHRNGLQTRAMLLPDEYQAEVDRRGNVLKAFELLRQKPNFPGLHIRVYDRGKYLSGTIQQGTGPLE
jgi:hypothetical protein